MKFVLKTVEIESDPLLFLGAKLFNISNTFCSLTLLNENRSDYQVKPLLAKLSHLDGIL